MTRIVMSDGMLIQDPIAYPYIGQLPVRDCIATLQDNGYLVYESTQMPLLELVGGKAKLPSRWGEVRDGVDQITALYEEAFGKFALARWHEAQAEKVLAQRFELTEDLVAGGYGSSPELVSWLIAAGWKK